MSQIVLGVGTSHSPLLAMGPEMWAERARDDIKRTAIQLSDGRVVDYRQLAQESGNRHEGKANLETFQCQSAVAQQALSRVAESIAQAQPDVVVVIGDDQEELFQLEHMPAVAVFYGEEIVMHPHGQAVEALPAWHQQALKGYSQDAAHVHLGAPAYARLLIDGLLDRGVDVAASARVIDPVRAGFGHAFGFVNERLFDGRRIPVVPVMLNTYFPPNVMRPWRCHDVGRILRQVIESASDNQRVAIVASGGLSHFATEEALDRRVLDAIRDGDAEALRSIPAHSLRSGSSEILNWIAAAGALEGLRHDWTEYVPVYRTPAGTGIGLAFTVWRP